MCPGSTVKEQFDGLRQILVALLGRLATLLLSFRGDMVVRLDRLGSVPVGARNI